MHLKKIQCSGFKSFADKISISFDKGITGIVGPNGSGKSNVIDAVRWVMGEQSAKHLRGKVATDIIFAGSAKRKPLGMAEVNLIFDNNEPSDFCPPEYKHEAEISISRRLYSDGTREYLINKKACRLKDIISFFATTGLGGRSYSMIQQGQVDRILNAKPEQIREILEEAAGTLAFKTRCIEAQKKLNSTNDNLLRLEDIISELERQRETLESQVEKAKQYREWTGELKTEELGLLAHNYHHLKTELTKHEELVKVEEGIVVDVTVAIQKLEERQEVLQDQLDKADPDLEGLHERVSIIREDIARAENKIMNSESVLETGDEDLEKISQDIESDRENLQKVEAQIEKQFAELNEAKTMAIELKDLVENFQDEVDAVDESAKVYESRQEDCEDQIKNVDRLLDSNGVRCESIERERERISKDRVVQLERQDTLNSEIATVKSRLDEVKAEASNIKAGLEEELAKKTELENRVASLTESLREYGLKRDNLKESYFDKKAKHSSLEEMLESASDVAGSIQRLGESSDNAENLHLGLLTDHIKLKDDASDLSKKGLEAFEKWSERLIVRSLSEFNQLVRIGNDAEISSIPVTVISEATPYSQEAVKNWSEKFDAEPLSQYVEITSADSEISSFLDRVYHLPTLELGSEEIRELPRGIIVFTSQGVIASSRDEFVISSRNSKGILSRKADLEVLSNEIAILQGSLAETQAQIDEWDLEQRTSSATLRELSTLLKDQNDDVMKIMNELGSLEQENNHKQELLDATTAQIADFKVSDEKLVGELGELGEARISLGRERHTVLEELEIIREEACEIEERKEEVYRLHQSRKIDLAKYEVKSQTLDQSCEQTREQLERLQTVLSRKFEEQAELEVQINDARTNSAKYHEDIKLLIVEREDLEKRLTDKREENAEILQNLRKVDEELKKEREKLHAADKKMNSLSVEVERASIGVTSAVGQAAEKYHIELSDYECEIDPDFNASNAQRGVTRLRNKLEGLGAINMMAIEEYDHLKEREEFIFAQREEVTSSINLLEEAIGEMEETSKDRFHEMFLIINHEFGNLFPILFPGGEARLQLTDENDMLNSGVEIMVRLPGKRQQNMNLFSGGEKALTAIALIFALLKSKPTPFCFLDEVDAPLDEANVGRYNRVLEALSDRFQFIVITHNRRTMEVLDTLYGVTMQEPGVSKIVGVDLSKDLPDHLKKAFKANKANEKDATPEQAFAAAPKPQLPPAGP